MIVIKSIIPFVDEIIGIQNFNKDTNYVLSKFSVSVDYNGNTLVYHTLTGQLVLFRNDESFANQKDELVKSWFYVPRSFNENKLSDDFYKLATVLKKSSSIKTSYTIFTTTDCNARCFYCYELGRTRLAMSDKVALDAANYIINNCGEEEVSLHWFGGEPLYNKSAIDIITQTLSDNNIPFHSKMISNGYYLDETTCKNATERWHLKNVQITIDGTKEIYQNTKAYIDHDDYAFERVLNNIEYALNNDISVTVRLNVDKRNVYDLHDLVTLLAGRFGSDKRFGVYTSLIKPLGGKIHSFDDELEEYEELEKLNNDIRDLGIDSKLFLNDRPILNQCMADNDKAETILPDGRIGRCEHYSESESVGSIYSDVRDIQMLKSWQEMWSNLPECENCPLYPRCRWLVKCCYTPNHCSELRRNKLIESLKRKMIATYERYRKDHSEELTERN